MKREAVVYGGEHDGEAITCEDFGYTPDTRMIWWIPETKELFSYENEMFIPYDGPVIHGTGYSF